jgi:hypothetical protein
MPARALAIRLLSTLSVVAVLSVAGAAASPALAQGKGNNHAAKPTVQRSLPPGQAKKHVSPAQGVVVAREVLVANGYTVVRVEQVGPTQVIYYRRGNNGRGRGLGPVEKMVVRPAGSVVVFDAAPEKVLVDIRLRIGA